MKNLQFSQKTEGFAVISNDLVLMGIIIFLLPLRGHSTTTLRNDVGRLFRICIFLSGNLSFLGCNTYSHWNRFFILSSNASSFVFEPDLDIEFLAIWAAHNSTGNHSGVQTTDTPKLNH